MLRVIDIFLFIRLERSTSQYFWSCVKVSVVYLSFAGSDFCYGCYLSLQRELISRGVTVWVAVLLAVL